MARSVPGVAGVLIQFPFLGAIAAILTGAKNGAGQTLSGYAGSGLHPDRESRDVRAHHRRLLGVARAVRASGGGKWVVEAPYVMHAANALQYNLGWVVQIYNAAEALPNLINPFWMLPILGILGLGPRSDRLHHRPVRDQSAAGAFSVVGARRDAAVSSAARAARDRPR